MGSRDAGASLDGGIVVVTGAGRGLGRAFAHRLASDGAAVAVVDIDLHSYTAFELEAAAMTADTTDAEIRAAGGTSRGYEVDLTDPDAVLDAFERIASDLGPITGLVCNAGGGSGGVHDNRAASVPVGSVELMMQRNLYTTINCCTAAVPIMRAGDKGAIVTMGSINGLAPTEDGGYAHYAMSKAAIIIYTKYLARELGVDNIRANVLAPGTVPTGRLSQIWADAGTRVDSSRVGALGRHPAVAEIAEVMRFLIGNESSYMTGQVLTVDGGATL